MKALKTLHQGKKTERVLISSGVGLRELSLRIRRRALTKRRATSTSEQKMRCESS